MIERSFIPPPHYVLVPLLEGQLIDTPSASLVPLLEGQLLGGHTMACPYGWVFRGSGYKNIERYF